jgi:Cu-Zn family superoxide dismutase
MRSAILRKVTFAAGTAAALCVLGCGRWEPQREAERERWVEEQCPEPAGPPARVGTVAVATLKAAPGSTISGSVVFVQRDTAIEVFADIEGLEPGTHGFHIHEKGECTAPDFKSAGGHFAPLGQKHGSPLSPEHHAGDLGNIEAGPDGQASLHAVSSDFVLAPQERTTIRDLAVVVHAKPDDLTSQPSGDAGARVACGVIHVVEAPRPGT